MSNRAIQLTMFIHIHICRWSTFSANTKTHFWTWLFILNFIFPFRSFLRWKRRTWRFGCQAYKLKMIQHFINRWMMTAHTIWIEIEKIMQRIDKKMVSFNENYLLYWPMWSMVVFRFCHKLHFEIILIVKNELKIFQTNRSSKQFRLILIMMLDKSTMI